MEIKTGKQLKKAIKKWGLERDVTRDSVIITRDAGVIIITHIIYHKVTK